MLYPLSSSFTNFEQEGNRIAIRIVGEYQINFARAPQQNKMCKVFLERREQKKKKMVPQLPNAEPEERAACS